MVYAIPKFIAPGSSSNSFHVTFGGSVRVVIDDQVFDVIYIEPLIVHIRCNKLKSAPGCVETVRASSESDCVLLLWIHATSTSF